MKNNKKTSGFTLIELLMVIAIIGILAGILIPTVGAVRKQANIAASKAQLSSYANAIQLFKGEYNYYPFITSAEDTLIDLSKSVSSSDFIKVLSGRDPSNGTPVTEGGNRRRIAFHSFSESEFLVGDDDTVSLTQLSDRFNNPVIKILIDGNGDNQVKPSPDGNLPSAPKNPIRTNVTAWVEGDDDLGFPGYSLWD
jgi:prepilin-type N-terminal cleavage/methylation domain-containing protein